MGKAISAFIEKVNFDTASETGLIIEEQIQNEIQNFENEFIDKIKSLSDYYVYLMIDTTNKYHKIGISKDPEYRERTLQSEKPTIELVTREKFQSKKMALSIEKLLHEKYKTKNLRGEWYDLCETDITKIKEILKFHKNE